MRCHCAAVAMLGVALVIVPAAHSQNLPSLPQAWVDTSYPAAGGSTINVAAGGNLQNAIDGANPGDTIKIQAGATFTGSFTLRAKSGSSFIIIRSSALDANLPPPGTRIDPTYAAQMPKIVSPDSTPAFHTEPGAHHYRLVGLEITVAAGVPENYGLVSLGDSSETDLSAVPSFIILDRLYIHGLANQSLRRGVALNSASSAVIDSYISEAHETAADTEAIMGWNGPGPFKITNNYLEASGENLLFGGADPAIPNLVPSDIEVRRNYFFKPLKWKPGDPSYDGFGWVVKNLMELKNAQRVLAEGNTYEHNWAQDQNGYAILFTVRNQNGTAPWSVVQDVTFIHNRVRHVGAAINILGMDNPQPSQQTKRILISDNGRLFQILSGAADVTIDHNTAFQSGEIVAASGDANIGFTFRNNIAPNNLYGVGGDNDYGNPLAALADYFPGAVFRRNVIQGGNPVKYPLDNFFPPALADIQFVDLAGANYRLQASSLYKNMGTDGKDCGADIDGLDAATQAHIDTPSMFSASATSTSQVTLSWLPVSGATSYEVWRSATIGGAFTLAVTTAATSTVDGGRAADTTYLYQVRALGIAGSSGFSPIDAATTTMFADMSLPGVTIKGVHLTEVRTAVNAMRVAGGLTPQTFTDGSLGGVPIKRLHFVELRTALDAARSAIGLGEILYTDPALGALVTTVKALHVNELRAGTQ